MSIKFVDNGIIIQTREKKIRGFRTQLTHRRVYYVVVLFFHYLFILYDHTHQPSGMIRTTVATHQLCTLYLTSIHNEAKLEEQKTFRP